MPMQMGFRWYGEGNDKISLSDIKQIPGVTSIVWALHNKMPGEIWTVEEIAEVQKQLEPCLLYTSPSPRDRTRSRMPSSA